MYTAMIKSSATVSAIEYVSSISKTESSSKTKNKTEFIAQDHMNPNRSKALRPNLPTIKYATTDATIRSDAIRNWIMSLLLPEMLK